ncbi:MAG: hypothetical protein Q7S70_02180 [bacterium]|nr:hypothetical protein [bacterium]
MKKFLPAIVFLTLAVALVAPVVASADAGTPIECVKLKRDITVDSTPCPKDSIVGSPNAGTPGAGNPNCPLVGTLCPVGGTEKWGAFALLNTINTIVDWVFAFLVIFAVFYVVMGAFNILTSSGSPEKVTSGRNNILYAAIGLLVAFIARAIPSLVRAIMGF